MGPPSFGVRSQTAGLRPPRNDPRAVGSSAVPFRQRAQLEGSLPYGLSQNKAERLGCAAQRRLQVLQPVGCLPELGYHHRVEAGAVALS